jgi:hypothetical protein
MSVSMLHCPFPGIPCAGDRPHTIYNGEVACSYPGMVELLAVLTLHETNLGFVRLYPDCNIAKARQFEYLMGL